MSTEETPICCRCKEDFPLAEEPTSWRMGFLRPLKKAPRSIVNKFREWLDDPVQSFLCGNCYFDLTETD